jgi:uncharacterized protein (DUF2336 family)
MGLGMQVESVTSLDVTVLEAVIETGGVGARIALARQLCTLIAAEDTPDTECEAVLPVALKLAVDEERAVRAVIAEELSTVATLHPDLLFCVIAGEDELALPFLKITPSLNPWHMLAVLRVGDEARQCTVASRHDITAEAAAHIIKSSAVPVVLAMMDNEMVKLETTDMHALYARLGQSGPLVDRLLALPNLPLDIRITQAKRAASRMRQLMAERSWLPANDASELVADAEDGAVLQVLANAPVEELLRAISFLATKNLLTPALIIRAACLGEMRVVEASLAHLAGYAPQKAASIMYGRGGMKSMVSKCGLACLLRRNPAGLCRRCSRSARRGAQPRARELWPPPAGSADDALRDAGPARPCQADRICRPLRRRPCAQDRTATESRHRPRGVILQNLNCSFSTRSARLWPGSKRIFTAFFLSSAISTVST